MRESGAHTLAQDEASCVVFGMLREAIRLGAAVEILLDRTRGEAASYLELIARWLSIARNGRDQASVCHPAPSQSPSHIEKGLPRNEGKAVRAPALLSGRPCGVIQLLSASLSRRER